MGTFGINLNTTGMGLGTGIDVQGTVSQLVQAARAPEQAMTQEQQLLTAQSSALNNLNSLLSTLQTAVNALEDPAGQLTAREALSRAVWDRSNEVQRATLLEIFGFPQAPEGATGEAGRFSALTSRAACRTGCSGASACCGFALRCVPEASKSEAAC